MGCDTMRLKKTPLLHVDLDDVADLFRGPKGVRHASLAIVNRHVGMRLLGTLLVQVREGQGGS